MEDQALFDRASANANAFSSSLMGYNLLPEDKDDWTGTATASAGMGSGSGSAMGYDSAALDDLNFYEETFDAYRMGLPDYEDSRSNLSSSTSSSRNLNNANTSHTTPEFSSPSQKMAPPSYYGLPQYVHSGQVSPTDDDMQLSFSAKQAQAPAAAPAPPSSVSQPRKYHRHYQVPKARQMSASSLPIDRLNLSSINQNLNPTAPQAQTAPAQAPQSHSNRFSPSAQFPASISSQASSQVPGQVPSQVSGAQAPAPAQAPEERTVNPRELFTNKIPVSSSFPSLSTLFKNENRMLKNYTTSKPKDVPVQQVVQQNIPASYAQVLNQKIDFKMNDECFNAITYWLNNTLQTVDSDDNALDNGAAEIMANPTGVIKSDLFHKRRNSIQFSQLNYGDVGDDAKESFAITPSLPSSQIPPSAGQKKKKRKSQSGGEHPILSPIELKSSEVESPATTSGGIVNTNGPVTPAMPRRTSPARSTRPTPQTTPKANQRERMEAPDSEEEPPAFPCPNCDKHFKRSEHLKRHHRSVHSNIRPFHCKYCDKRFSRSDNLAQHLKTHYKTNSNGSTSIIYGNPNVSNRKKRDSSTSV